MAEIDDTAIISVGAPSPPKISLRLSLGSDRFHFVFGDLARDARAGVMILMAISLLALATATGVGIDFARALNFKSGLQGAVDTAAIAGASIYLNAGYASQATATANA